MVKVFSINWEKRAVNTVLKKNYRNNFTIRITCIQEDGQLCYFDRHYEDWFGVCTDHIGAFCKQLKYYFPGISVRYKKLEGDYRKVLPYFEERLKTGKYMRNVGKSFYKLYVSAPIEEIGEFFNLYKISYYKSKDWLDRIYIDMCTRYSSDNGFFYHWYEVDTDHKELLKSFHLLSDVSEMPNWIIAAFDLETVCMSGENRIPDGTDSNDRIVMISVVKWNNFRHEERVFYLNPCPQPLLLDNASLVEYTSEATMLHDFHVFIQDCQIITGYNINNFDMPCIFARLLWLGMFKILKQYQSQKIGKYLVTTFRNKLSIDAYVYFRTFSSYDLSNFKLDIVAKTKLGGGGKDPVDAIGIHAWYQNTSQCVRELCLSDDRNACYEVFKPPKINRDRFGTFKEYLHYCLQDSKLVRELFRKEMILEFLIARSNFIAKDLMGALYFGNSRFMLEVFKTFGTVLGFFVNIDFFQNFTDSTKFQSMFKNGKFQGGLNHCSPATFYEDVAVLDFASMYPSCLLSSNLCYSTCTILNKEEYSQLAETSFTAIPYRNHSDKDFQLVPKTSSTSFRYPEFDPQKDSFVIVVDQRTIGFLPTLVTRLLTLRKHHQKLWKQTKHVIHYNIQLCIKILINSMYGVMGNKNSRLAYIVVAMSIVTLARYQILGAYHYVRAKDFTVCYIDTDSLMISGWPVDNCDEINDFLNISHVELKFEERMKQLQVISKKRYVYASEDGKLHLKGFQKKVNDLTQRMAYRIITALMNLRGKKGDSGDGWILWVRILTEALIECRDPRKYYITRKTKNIEEYKSKVCTSVKLLKKYPEKAGEYIDFTYSRADVSIGMTSSWIMEVSDCRYVDFEKLFVSQKKIFCLMLDIGFWRNKYYLFYSNMVFNTIKWKRFVLSELLYYSKNRTNRCLELIVEKNVRYTFRINEHVRCRRGKGRMICTKVIPDTGDLTVYDVELLRKAVGNPIGFPYFDRNTCTWHLGM